MERHTWSRIPPMVLVLLVALGLMTLMTTALGLMRFGPGASLAYAWGSLPPQSTDSQGGGLRIKVEFQSVDWRGAAALDLIRAPETASHAGARRGSESASRAVWRGMFANLRRAVVIVRVARRVAWSLARHWLTNRGRSHSHEPDGGQGPAQRGEHPHERPAER
jgi:hypothetical protein